MSRGRIASHNLLRVCLQWVVSQFQHHMNCTVLIIIEEKTSRAVKSIVLYTVCHVLYTVGIVIGSLDVRYAPHARLDSLGRLTRICHAQLHWIVKRKLD